MKKKNVVLSGILTSIGVISLITFSSCSNERNIQQIKLNKENEIDILHNALTIVSDSCLYKNIFTTMLHDKLNDSGKYPTFSDFWTAWKTTDLHLKIGSIEIDDVNNLKGIYKNIDISKYQIEFVPVKGANKYGWDDTKNLYNHFWYFPINNKHNQWMLFFTLNIFEKNNKKFMKTKDLNIKFTNI